MSKTNIKCIGFIMDGNRRWAKEKGIPTLKGHRLGYQVFLDSMDWVCEAGISHAVYYAFSTENWMRDKTEVSYLMDLFREVLIKIEEEQVKRKTMVRIIGRREDFPEDIQKSMVKINENNDKYKDSKTTIWVALSYGGRAEIVEAVNKAVGNGEMVDEKKFGELLWTADMPDPDIIVRTGGEQRLSNFMTWKSVYSELYFMDKHWPALTKTDFEDILIEYEKRERRQGK